MTRTLALATSLLVLAGCGTTLHSRGAPLSFGGLETLLAEPGVKQTAVLVVHGFGRHEPGHSAELQQRLTTALGMTPRAACADHSIGGGRYGRLRICEYGRPSGDGTVRVYELTWSPLTSPFKDRYLKYDEDTTGRALINGWAKREMIDERFADAVLYLGALKREMQKPIEYALCFMLNEPLTAAALRGPVDPTRACDVVLSQDESGATERVIAIVTASLGSTMVWETLVAMHESTEATAAGPSRRDIARDILSRTRLVFMLANQLPLLRLATMAKPLEPATESLQRAPASAFPPGVEAALESAAALRPVRIDVVAIADANDLLGYALPEDLPSGPAAFLRVSNVEARLAPSWLLFANPLRAHTGHVDDPEVVDAIVCGRPSTCVPR